MADTGAVSCIGGNPYLEKKLTVVLFVVCSTPVLLAAQQESHATSLS